MIGLPAAGFGTLREAPADSDGLSRPWVGIAETGRD